MPDSTTSRSISSTGSPARARRPRPRPCRGDRAGARSTSPATSSRRSPARASPYAHGDELARQAEAMEGYFELVVETLVGAGYRWYETANFCRPGRQARHNLGYWLGRDYLGLGIGAVSTVGGLRWRNRPEPGRLPGSARRGTAAAAGGGGARAGGRAPRAAPARAAARRAGPARRRGRRRRRRGARPHGAARARRAAGRRTRPDAARPLPRRRRDGRAAWPKALQKVQFRTMADAQELRLTPRGRR